ncbi:MAG: aminotransferase class IV, partial [Planctomycetota bacterium]
LAVTLTPISARRYGAIHHEGFHLAVPDVAALPAATLSPAVKTRSRLHWYLADRLAAEAYSGAVAVLADGAGGLTETNLGNLFVVSGGSVRTPPADHVLPGLSRRFLIGLAESVGIPVVEAPIFPKDLLKADEAFVTSSVICVAPVTKFEGVEIGNGQAGPLTTRLLDEWSRRVGVSIAEQFLAAQ